MDLQLDADALRDITLAHDDAATKTSGVVPAMKTPSAQIKELLHAVDSLDDYDECRRFFLDLCTPAELEAMSGRWQVVKLLASGLAYREIYEKSGVSTATITRVARALHQGEGGYRQALEKNDKAKRRVRSA